MIEILLKEEFIVGLSVRYTNYLDNVVHKFYKQDSKSGVEVFRIFNSLNYIKKLKLGVYATGSAG